jgi:salicylate hydroxylase
MPYVPRTPLKAVVAGGGVAGAATAIGLRRIGVDVIVYESRPDPAGPVGSFLSLAGNGLRGLTALNCLEPIQRAGFDVPRQRMWSSSGRLLGDVPRGRLSTETLFSVTLRRSQLVEQLRNEAVAAGATIVTGRRLVAATESPAAICMQFDDDSEAEADVLVGADGIWSTTRRLVDPTAPEPTYAGIYTLSGISDVAMNAPARSELEPGCFNLVFARRGAFIYLPHPDGQIWWAAQVASPIAPDPADVGLAELKDLYRHEATPSTILDATVTLEPLTLHHTLRPVPGWHSARIALLGDAAHPVGAGQGASMAIEDAVVLADRLSPAARSGSAEDLKTGLEQYVQLRQARTAKMVKTGAANRDAKTAGPIRRTMNDLIMPFVFRHFYEKATAWLYSADLPTLPTQQAEHI